MTDQSFRQLEGDEPWLADANGRGTGAVDSEVTSMPGPQGTAVVARVDDTGQKVLWSVDTGTSRFGLQQILPGEVSEPLLVIVEHESGKQATHSLWQRVSRAD